MGSSALPGECSCGALIFVVRWSGRATGTATIAGPGAGLPVPGFVGRVSCRVSCGAVWAGVGTGRSTGRLPRRLVGESGVGRGGGVSALGGRCCRTGFGESGVTVRRNGLVGPGRPGTSSPVTGGARGRCRRRLSARGAGFGGTGVRVGGGGDGGARVRYRSAVSGRVLPSGWHCGHRRRVGIGGGVGTGGVGRRRGVGGGGGGVGAWCCRSLPVLSVSSVLSVLSGRGWPR